MLISTVSHLVQTPHSRGTRTGAQKPSLGKQMPSCSHCFALRTNAKHHGEHSIDI